VNTFILIKFQIEFLAWIFGGKIHEAAERRIFIRPRELQ